MSYKWNENSTFIFLNVYQKYPCLWNPYNVKYYDCLAKNEALKNIIKELNIPDLSISDCLEQIKVIREKYGQEQIRIIKGFQSQYPYKSPFAWLPVISEMLAKVIIDEGKLQTGMRSMETISSNILKKCVTSSYAKYKSIPNFPCAQETKLGVNYKAKPRRNTKFTRADKEIYLKKDPDIFVDKIEGKDDARLLQCPSCGWEDIKPEKLNVIAKKTYEQTKPLDIAVPCAKYTSLADKPYECYAYQYQTANDTHRGRYNDTVLCPSFSRNLPSYIGYSASVLPTRTYKYYPQSKIGQQSTRETIVTSKPKFCMRETLSGEQLFPERGAKQVGTCDQHRDEGIQNTICVSKANVTPSPKCATVQVSDRVRKCHKEVQSKFLIPQEELKHAAVNTVECCDKGIQNTICVARVNFSDCQAFKKHPSMIKSTVQESKQVDTNTVECSDDVRNAMGMKLKTVGCSAPNFVLMSIDGNYVPLVQTDLKQLAIDKCKIDTDFCREETEKTCLALDSKKLVENEVCVKGICSPDAIEIIKHNSAVMQTLLQCLEKIISLREKTKTRSLSSLSLKKDDVNSDSSEATICGPCKLEPFATSSAIELESSNCLEETEEDNAIAMFIKTFLELTKHALVLNSRKRAESMQEYVRKEDVIDTFTILNKIKDCVDQILKIYTARNCSKRQLSNKSCPRYKSKCPPKANSNLSLIRESKNGTDQFTASYANSKDVEVLYRPSMSKMEDLSANYTTFVEAAVEEKPSVKNKEITARSENHDIDLNVPLSLVSLRNSGTQYTPKQLQDVGIVTEHDQSFQEKINIGTQSCEPILVRVIKCDNSEGILKSDKETCVRVARAKSIDKCAETYPVLCLSKNVHRKYLVRECYNEDRHPDVSHVREKEVNRIDYRTSLLSDRNYRYNKECRSSLQYNQDWRKANVPIFGLSNRRASRIPLCARSHKYTRRRTDLYSMTQSYI